MPDFRNGEGSGLKHFLPQPKYQNSKEKCKCGNDKFDYQKICGVCWLKEQNNKKDENSISTNS